MDLGCGEYEILNSKWADTDYLLKGLKVVIASRARGLCVM